MDKTAANGRAMGRAEPAGPAAEAALSAAAAVAESAASAKWDSKAAIVGLLAVAEGDPELLWDAIGRLGEARANSIGFMTWVGTAMICAMATKPPLASLVGREMRSVDDEYGDDFEDVQWRLVRHGLMDQTPTLSDCRGIALQFFFDHVPSPTHEGETLSLREAIGQALDGDGGTWGAEAGNMADADMARFKGAMQGAIERRLVGRAAAAPHPSRPRGRPGL